MMQAHKEEENKGKESNQYHFVIKVGMVGGSALGDDDIFKKWVNNRYSDDYIQTLGVNFMEKQIHLKNVDVTMIIWALKSTKPFETLLPLVVIDSHVVIFSFDLSRPESLVYTKYLYKECKQESNNFESFVIGTKYNVFSLMDKDYKQDITKTSEKICTRNKCTINLLFKKK